MLAHGLILALVFRVVAIGLIITAIIMLVVIP